MALDNRLPSYESLLEFSEVYLRAIALAWEEPSFARDLQRNAPKALRDWLDYVVPWDAEIRVRPVNREYGHFTPACRDKNDQWLPGKWTLPRNKIRYGLPERPDKHAHEAIALAAYYDSGPVYLFTCC
ncbi:MAG: BMA_0021/BMA_0022 family TOMM bacteriocin [Pseudomonadota bacterium]